MTVREPAPDGTLRQDLFVASLPERHCDACGRRIERRVHRVKVHATWREHEDTLCAECWGTVMRWAALHALKQEELPL